MLKIKPWDLHLNKLIARVRESQFNNQHAHLAVWPMFTSAGQKFQKLRTIHSVCVIIPHTHVTNPKANRIQTTHRFWLQIPAFSLTSFVTVETLLEFLEPQSPHLYYGTNTQLWGLTQTYRIRPASGTQQVLDEYYILHTVRNVQTISSDLSW